MISQTFATLVPLLSSLKSAEPEYEVPSADSLGVIETKLDQPGVYEAIDDNAAVSKRTWSDAYDHKPKALNEYEIPAGKSEPVEDELSMQQPHYDIASDTSQQQPHYDIASDTSTQPHYDVATDTTKIASSHYDLASPPEQVPSFTFGFGGVAMDEEEDFA